MPITRFKLPFGKMPAQFDENDNQQWIDYCAVTDVNSDKPNEIVLIDLNLSDSSKTQILKTVSISEATDNDLAEYGIQKDDRLGLPRQESKLNLGDIENGLYPE